MGPIRCLLAVVFLITPAFGQDSEFVFNTIGPETLLPLKERGIIRLAWPHYKPRSRFDFKPAELPIYRIFVAPENIPARKGRVHMTYDNSYPLTNLGAGKKYNILVDVEQDGRVILKEKKITARHLVQMVKWYAAPKAAGGSPSNPGSYNAPVDISFVNGNAGPGDVVVLKSGRYVQPGAGDKNRFDTKLHPMKSGAPGAHILILAESNDISRPNHVSFQTAWGNITVNKTDYVVFDGINCDSDQGQNAKALTALMGEYDHRPTGVIIRNIFYRAATADKQIMVNAARYVLIENCFFPGSTDSHNVYMCNNTNNRPQYADSRGIFRNNICMNSTRNNLHANGYFDNFIIENNIMVGAKVANISLATVHRNSYVRNNIAYSGAKQAMTLNFYQNMPYGVPLEDKTPCSNIHIVHNTLLVSSNTDSVYAAILISDTRRQPLKHTIQGLYIKNNIMATQKASNRNNLIKLWQARHLNKMEVEGNVFFAAGDQWGYNGEINVPDRTVPFTLLEEKWKKKEPFECMDAIRDPQNKDQLEKISIRLQKWSDNRMAKSYDGLFVNRAGRDYRLGKNSEAVGAGVVDEHTQRVVRDIYGNIRSRRSGESHAGAVVAGSAREATTRVSEYQLAPPAEPVAEHLVPGKPGLAAAARLIVRSPYSTSLGNLFLEMIIHKTDPGVLVDVNRDFIAEVVVNGKRQRLQFFKGDKPGYEKFWTDGVASGLNIPAKSSEVLDVKVYITVNAPDKINFISTTFAHDNIWGFDARGRKMAVLENIEIGFGQAVKR